MKRDSGARIAGTFLRQHKARFAAALLCRSLYVIVPMQVPILTGVIIDGLTRQDISIYGVQFSSGNPIRAVQVGVLGLLAVALTYGITAYAQTVASHKLSRNFVSSLRKTIVEKATQLGNAQHQKFGAGDLMDRALTDTANVRRFMERVYIQSVINVLRIVYPLTMLLLIDPLLTLIAVSVLPPQLILSRFFQNRLHTATHKSRRSHSDLTTVVKENLDGAETIKLLNAEAASVRQMSLTADRVESDELDASRASAAVSGTVFLMTSLGIALTWWQGALRVISGEMTPGSLIVFTGFVAFAYMPFRQFSTVLSTYRRGLVSLERIGELLDVRPSIEERPDASPLCTTDGRIELKNVSFRYAQQPVLRGVELTLEPRRITAIVGPSGSGKSSLLRLITRLYDPEVGEIGIDGQDIRRVTLDSLRSSVVMVPQHPVLFSGTVLENLQVSDPAASEGAIRAACDDAGALEFIERFERGFHTRLGRGGISLSGGQAQRLAIARALITRPRIVLMDEPTSALDPTSETALLDTLCELKQQATVVVVAHRIKTIRQADQVVLMDAGRVVATGTHESLLATAPLYRTLFTAPATTAA